jgi:tRNA nucleotidyltransferase (CCA-adding enzyme)
LLLLLLLSWFDECKERAVLVALVESATTQPIIITIIMTETNANAPEQEQQPIFIPTRIIVPVYKIDGSNKGADDDNNNDNDKKSSFPSTIIVLELEEEERHLFETLRATADALAQGHIQIPSRPSLRTIQIRVAGGWVRDKILRLQTHDVDIAVDTCSGVEFAQLIQTYCEKENEKTGGKSQSCSTSKIGVIAANPSQSKHLETATMRVHGMDVDFCNLRHESYAGDSRIPTTQTIGTPTQDAFRRDFTMNSLFYNLQTTMVEDWTRRGHSDLLKGRVVTPLEAHQTFHDDPLRVLRAIRFAVRYNMEMDSDLKAACRNPQIHNELHRKVSRERVGKELEAMLSGKGANPIYALETIGNLKLAGSVFCLPEEMKMNGTIVYEQHQYTGTKEELAHLRELAWEESRNTLVVLPGLLERLRLNDTTTTTPTTSIDQRLVHVSVFLLPFIKLTYIDKKAKEHTCLDYMMRDGIKFKNKDVAGMTTIMDSVENMMQLLKREDLENAAAATNPSPTASHPLPPLRLQAGILLRNTKDLWVTTLVVAAVLLIRQQECHKDMSSTVNWYDRAHALYQTILDLGLDECWKIKPMLNGKALIQALGLEPGPQVGVYASHQIEWMLLHPVGTIDDLQHFLLNFKRLREREQNEATEHISKKMHL